ncbi:MAG: AAA family ATPase [Clostridia bacterium]|nr:AAA family ATPase [Clostridia bacterium]
MDKKDILKNVYEDFFGIEKIARENEKIARELEAMNSKYKPLKDEEIPEIIINKDEGTSIDGENEEAEREIDKDKFMKESFEEIDNLYINEESKDLLKKIIEYMRKYNEKIEKQYISFNLKMYSNNKETITSIVRILVDAGYIFKYLKDGDAAYYSMYDVEEANQIQNAYESKNSIVVLQKLEGLTEKEDSFKNKFASKFDEQLGKNEEQVLTIICANNKDIINDAFSKNDELLQKYFDFEITSIEPDVQDVYQDVLNKLEEKMDITDKFKVQLLDYITAVYANNNLPYPEYRDKLCEKILFTKQIPEVEKEKTMEEIFEELNALVGLDKVKNMLHDLVNLIELKNKTKDDLKIKNINLHMVFLGNPGTGKTTVARIVAEMLYNLKYIKQNKLIEVSSKDLVAEYVGQTAPKTNAVVQKALGGVLFVDEAYSLASGSGQGNSFNEEAIATLIQAMENYRDDLVVIFAGYTREMQDFLNANSGIVSRIGYTVEFEDYTPDELIQIFNQMMEKSGFIVTKEAQNKVKEIIEEYKDTKNCGNARFVRNIYEKSIVKHASNTKGKKGKKVLKTISKEDISTENLLKM